MLSEFVKNYSKKGLRKVQRVQRSQPLKGIKVIDFSTAQAGPLATKCLADHGATVIKVESRT
ncbi:CoA transferase, partial [Chloroflexota bacterium]